MELEIVEAKKKYTDRVQSLANAIVNLVYKEPVERDEVLSALEIATLLVQKMPWR